MIPTVAMDQFGSDTKKQTVIGLEPHDGLGLRFENAREKGPVVQMKQLNFVFGVADEDF